MAVYIDGMKAAFGRMVMCHMIADSHDELMAMADKLGVQRKWIQHEGTRREHFDICQSKRRLAVAAGAQEIGMLELGKKMFPSLFPVQTTAAIAAERVQDAPV